MIPTHFNQLIGNSSIKTYLTRMIEKRAISHSLLFAGPEGVGKSLFAHALAALTICGQEEQSYHRRKIESGNHPDIRIYRPEGKLGLHSMQALRQFSEEVYVPPYEASWKVFIVHDAERMLSYSANALLKTFEEPPLHTMIILLSSAPASLLPTILSRCRTLHFQSLTEGEIAQFLREQHQLTEQEAGRLAQLAQGSLSRAILLLKQKGDPNRELLLKMLSQGKGGAYKTLTSTVQSLVDQIETSKKQAEEAAKEELYKMPIEHLSAHQSHLLEKELEGRVTMSLFTEVNALFEHLLSWYRDLHLLHLKGGLSYMINKDYLTELEQVVQQGDLLALETVQKAIQEAHLALQRSTALSICLENLFLKLGFP